MLAPIEGRFSDGSTTFAQEPVFGETYQMVANLLTTSAGDRVENPSYYRAAQKRLRRLQRKLARAQRGSNSRYKALLALQRQQEHVANQRADFLNKLVHNLVRQYDGIALEDLLILNMVKNHHLSKSILDSGWSYFEEQLSAKAASAGRQLVLIDPAYTSRACSCCGALFQDFDLSTAVGSPATAVSRSTETTMPPSISCIEPGWTSP